MKKIISVFSVLALLIVSAQITGASSSWTNDNQTLISSGLPTGYEPSGAFWHSGLNKLLIVSDESGLAAMDEDGANVSSWTVGGDNEAITVVDPSGTLAYIGIEKPSRQIVEVNLSTGAATGKSWDLTTWLSGSDNAGMEALTYVPAGQHSFNTANGVFLANKETSSTIYAFDVNLNSSGTLTNVGTISTPAGYSTMRDMFFDRSSSVLYMLYGSKVVEMKLDGTIVDQYSNSGSYQEGITKSDDYTFIAHDSGPVYRYGTKSTTSTTGGTTTTNWTSETQTSIGTNLPTGYEPSGAYWHGGLNKLVVVSDGGLLSTMDEDGNNVTNYTLSGDNETVTGTSSSSNYVYVGVEQPTRKVVEFDLSTGTTTGNSWDLTTWLTGSDNNGLEALTYVPSGKHAFNTSEGVFLANKYSSSTIYAFVFGTSGSVTNVGSFTAPSASMSDMYYNESTGVLYALYEGLAYEMDTSGTVSSSYSVPGSSQEGIAMNDSFTFIAQDTGAVYRYDTRTTPITPVVTNPDADGDGYAASVDCNDKDSTVYTEQYYYTDKDLDGMGWGSLVPVCASTAPNGYSTNANEVKEYNDSIPNAGIEINGDKKDNDGDGKIDEGNNVASNGYHPYYSTLNPADRASVVANHYGFGGYKYGRIWVRYLDGSTWTYRPVNVNTTKTTSVVMDSASGYLFVTNALSGAVYTVNPYTGNLK